MLSRRAVVAAIGASALSGPAFANTDAMRRFDIFRKSDKIGEHVVTVRREGDAVVARTDVDIAVRFLGIAAYRYTLGYDERYEGGRLVRLSGTANDDGDPGYVNATANGAMLDIDGSAFSGQVDGAALPTSYWRPQSRQATPWISTQTGLILNVTGQPTSDPKAPAGASVWAASYAPEDFAVNLFYDTRDEWVGSTFTAGGEQGLYRVADETGALSTLA